MAQQHEADNKMDYVEFSASDMGGTKAFYSNVFGWKFEDYGPGYAAFADGRIAGGFTSAAEAQGKGPLVVIYCDDLAAAAERVRGGGGVIIREIFSFPGGRRFHFRDPNGNELAVWSAR